MRTTQILNETLATIAPERAQGALDLKTELSSALETFLENVDDLHKGRIQYLLSKIYDSTSSEVYAESLLEHVTFLQKFRKAYGEKNGKKGGNCGS